MLYTVMCTPPPQKQAMWAADVHLLTGECCVPLLADSSAGCVLLWLSTCTHPTPCDPPTCAGEKAPHKITSIPLHAGLPMPHPYEWGAVCPQHPSHERGLCLFPAEVVTLMGQLLAVPSLVCCSSSFPPQGLLLLLLCPVPLPSCFFYTSFHCDLFFASKVSIMTCNSLITNGCWSFHSYKWQFFGKYSPRLLYPPHIISAHFSIFASTIIQAVGEGRATWAPP